MVYTFLTWIYTHCFPCSHWKILFPSSNLLRGVGRCCSLLSFSSSRLSKCLLTEWVLHTLAPWWPYAELTPAYWCLSCTGGPKRIFYFKKNQSKSIYICLALIAILSTSRSTSWSTSWINNLLQILISWWSRNIFIKLSNPWLALKIPYMLVRRFFCALSKVSCHHTACWLFTLPCMLLVGISSASCFCCPKGHYGASWRWGWYLDAAWY